MAHFEIAREVKHSAIPDSWQLCFQYGTYVYDAEDADGANGKASELGYRFIWRRPNGHLQGARGQACLSATEITILLGMAAEKGWYPYRRRSDRRASDG